MKNTTKKPNPIVRVFMRRDELTQKEAESQYEDLRGEFNDALANDEDPIDVLYSYGLEIDYAIYLM